MGSIRSIFFSSLISVDFIKNMNNEFRLLPQHNTVFEVQEIICKIISVQNFPLRRNYFERKLFIFNEECKGSSYS